MLLLLALIVPLASASSCIRGSERQRWLVDQIEFYVAPSSGASPFQVVASSCLFSAVFFFFCFFYGSLKMKTLNAAPQKQRHFFFFSVIVASIAVMWHAAGNISTHIETHVHTLTNTMTGKTSRACV